MIWGKMNSNALVNAAKSDNFTQEGFKEIIPPQDANIWANEDLLNKAIARRFPFDRDGLIFCVN